MTNIFQKLFTPTKPTRQGILLWFSFMLLLSIFSITINFSFRNESVEISVTETNFAAQFFHSDSLRPVINKYKTSFVKGNPTLKIEKPNLLTKLLVPSSDFLFDPISTILIMLICMV